MVGAICHREGSQTLNDAKTAGRAVKGFTNNQLKNPSDTMASGSSITRSLPDLQPQTFTQLIYPLCCLSQLELILVLRSKEYVLTNI